MKNCGFTLIELLGVIVILALLIIIVFPSIVNSVKNSSEKTDDLTLELIYNATDMHISNNQGNFKKVNGNTYCVELSTLIDEGYLKSPIKLSDENITSSKLIKVIYQNGFDYELTDIGYCEQKEFYANGHIVYFDVSTGETCTDYTETQSNLGVKSGCMKFYIFNDDGGETLNLILDHNTTAIVNWNSSGSNTSGPSEVLTQLKTDTDAWVGTETPANYTMDQSAASSGAKYTVDYSEYKARLITANEIAQITGNTRWNEISSTGWYYFQDLSTNSETGRGDTCASTGCKYVWLRDRASIDCTKYGCLNNSDVSTYGYWTVSSSASSSDTAWGVRAGGSLYNDIVNGQYYSGVRPVIEVLKTKLN